MVKPVKKNDNPIKGGADIGHVHLKTADIARIRTFYVDILGFDVMADLPGALFISTNGYHHHLAFNTWESEGGSPPPPGTTGLYHVAIRYKKRAALADAVLRLTAAGWPVDGASDHGTHEAIYLSDPDQNGLELYWDRPKKDWPLDEKGHLTFALKLLDVKNLLSEK